MTASISASAWSAAYRVPGVYQAPSPRAPKPLPTRTDIAGFIGFEPRLRDSTPPSSLTGDPAGGPAFNVNVSAFQIRHGLLRTTVAANPRLNLPSPTPVIPDGKSIVYSIAVADRSGTGILVVQAGDVAQSGFEVAVDDPTLLGAVIGAMQGPPYNDTSDAAQVRHWIRLADVTVQRQGTTIRLTVHPALKITRCDDWNDFITFFGTPVDDGMLLARAVRAFFANGGARCYVCTISRPDFTDADGVTRAAAEMIGVQGDSELHATGLERLLMVDEVAIIDVPDLYARADNPQTLTYQLPPPAQDACFIPCPEILTSPIVTVTTGTGAAAAPLYPADLPAAAASTSAAASDVFMGLQLQLIVRCMTERWRAILLLSPPLVLDGGDYVPPAPPDAMMWRGIFDHWRKDIGYDDYVISGVALYFPWVLVQEVVDADVYALPPSPLAAGVMAKRDLARGPQIAPANETLSTVVGVTRPVPDDVNASLYSPEPDSNGAGVSALNVIRPFPGYGVQLWGARTISTDLWMQFVNVRRAVSAIERRCKAILDTLVFEPNTPLLWVQVTQSMLGVLVPMFDSGGLRGSTPAEAFYVRCDSTVNTPQTIALGRLIVEVGVAVAAPAEFIVFRLGRKEGVAEVFE